MASILEKIKAIEEEIARTQKNKATEKHLGILKAKLAKLRRQLYAKKKRGGGGFDIKKSGDATVALVGFPSVGKSSLLSALTGAKSKSAEYGFTTLSVIPGTLIYNGARIQILDLPGIIEGAKEGKGRGREIISVARKADLILILVDATALWQYEKIIEEIYAMGIRLNSTPPDIVIEKKARGGITVAWTTKEKGISKEEIEGVLHEYGIHNANVIFHEPGSVERLIDALEGNRAYIKGINVLMKADLADENIRKEAKKIMGEYITVSTITGEGLEELKKTIYETIGFVRVFTKDDFGNVAKEPLVIKRGSTIKDICLRIHSDLLKNFKYALVWGKSAKFPGQKVGLEHVVEDGDVIRIVAK